MISQTFLRNSFEQIFSDFVSIVDINITSIKGNFSYVASELYIICWAFFESLNFVSIARLTCHQHNWIFTLDHVHYAVEICTKSLSIKKNFSSTCLRSQISVKKAAIVSVHIHLLQLPLFSRNKYANGNPVPFTSTWKS